MHLRLFLIMCIAKLVREEDLRRITDLEFVDDVWLFRLKLNLQQLGHLSLNASWLHLHHLVERVIILRHHLLLGNSDTLYHCGNQNCN